MEKETNQNLTMEELHKLIDERLEASRKETHIEIGAIKLKAFVQEPLELVRLGLGMLQDENVKKYLDITKAEDKIKSASYTD